MGRAREGGEGRAGGAHRGRGESGEEAKGVGKRRLFAVVRHGDRPIGLLRLSLAPPCLAQLAAAPASLKPEGAQRVE